MVIFSFQRCIIPNFNDTLHHWIRDVAKISLRTAPEEVFDAIRVLEKAKKLGFFFMVEQIFPVKFIHI